MLRLNVEEIAVIASAALYLLELPESQMLMLRSQLQFTFLSGCVRVNDMLLVARSRLNCFQPGTPSTKV